MSPTSPLDANPLPHSAEAFPVRGLFSVPGLVVLCVLMTMAMTWKSIADFMTTGLMVDPDDAMRLSQVHDFLNGQGWFDLTAWRLDPPLGVFMHWTRIVDVPMAGLVWLFRLFADPETADRLMRLVFPMAMLAAMAGTSALVARRLVGPLGPLVTILLTLLGGAGYGYFAPGRVDHDHVAIVLLMLMVYWLLRALDAAEVRAAAITGLVIAANLSVSLEVLPFVVVGVAVLPTAWMFYGAPVQRCLLFFSLGLLVGLPVAFVLTVAPSRYLNGACDTLSAAHMVAGMTGGLLCLALAMLTPVLTSLSQRIVAALVAGGLTIAALALTYPACLGDPYANLDPVLKEFWLDAVTEARPMLKAMHFQPDLLQLVVVPVLLGLAGCIWAALRETGVTRQRWIALSAMVVAGCAASIWQVRASAVVAPFALLGSAWIVVKLTEKMAALHSGLVLPVLLAATMVQTPLFLAAVIPGKASEAVAKPAANALLCSSQAAFAAIASLPRGVILAPIDSGAHLLARTPHGVVAAPFHRNEHGNRLSLDAFRADPVAAEAIVRRSGANYVVLCPDISDTKLFHEISPEGLAAYLDEGKVPAWLQPLKLDTPFLVFAVR